MGQPLAIAIWVVLVGRELVNGRQEVSRCRVGRELKVAHVAVDAFSMILTSIKGLLDNDCLNERNDA